MRIEESSYNPLPDLFKIIPEAGLVLTEGSIKHLAVIFEYAGIFTESIEEVLQILVLFKEWYGLISLEEAEPNKYILRNLNGQNT